MQLLRGLGIENRPRLIALHEHNERDKAAELAELAREQDVLLVSDAGMPTVSDPGFVLVQAAIAAGVTVSALPGPSAVLMALALSGLPTDRFAFEGFLPRKGRLPALRALAAEPRTLVFFESPHRRGRRRCAIWPRRSAPTAPPPCAASSPSSTKRSHAAPSPSWREQFADGARGEIVLVVGGAPRRRAVPRGRRRPRARWSMRGSGSRRRRPRSPSTPGCRARALRSSPQISLSGYR